MRIAFAATLILCALGAQAIPQESATTSPQKNGKRKIPCKTEQNASMCYWAHGRLNFANGNPSFRIWKIGTKRILAIHSGPAVMQFSPSRYVNDGEDPEFPSNIDKIYRAEYKRRVSAGTSDADSPDPVYADFEICPLEPERSGEMQRSCIESAKHTVVERWTPTHTSTVIYPDPQ